jgi:hypothetical protein
MDRSDFPENEGYGKQSIGQSPSEYSHFWRDHRTEKALESVSPTIVPDLDTSGSSSPSSHRRRQQYLHEKASDILPPSLRRVASLLFQANERSTKFLFDESYIHEEETGLDIGRLDSEKILPAG